MMVKIKIFLKKTIPTVLFTLLAVVVVLPRGASAAVTAQAIGVPMYQFPTIGTYWSDITGAGASKVPFIIADPATGPGTTVDPFYTTAINNAVSQGIRVLGYVNAGYQSVNYQTLLDDVNGWHQLYPNVSGIFIDLVQEGSAADKCYIASIYNHIKNVHPNDLVILNPGTHISSAYEPYGDIFVNAENTFAAYQAGWSIQYPGFEDNPAYQNRFMQIINTTSAANYPTALSLVRSHNADWTYITDDTAPNAYDTTPSYWSTELSDVSSLPAPTIPNRGKTQLPSGCQDLTATTNNTVTTAAQRVKTTSAITVSNASTYNVEPTTRIAFALPSGVSLTGSGTNWTCDTGSCSFSGTVPATGSASVLSAVFTAGCDYSSGDVAATLTNFAGNASTFSVTPTRPGDCAAAGLTDTGMSVGLISLTAFGLLMAGLKIGFMRTRIHYVLRGRR